MSNVDLSPGSRSTPLPQNSFMDQFNLEARTQRVWDLSHAVWFTLMGLGGGVFLAGRILNLTDDLGHWFGIPMVDIVSFVAIAIGGLILVADLGRPLQFWRAFANIRTSWISWGAWSDLVFLIVAGLLVLPELTLGGSQPFNGLGWEADGSDTTGLALEILAGAAAVIVMTYAGAVLARPRSIPYWNSPAIPIQFLLSSAAMSLATVLLLMAINDQPISGGHMALLGTLTAGLLATMAVHLLTHRDAPGKQQSLNSLLRGPHRRVFVGMVLVVGTLIPTLLAFIGAGVPEARAALSMVAFALLMPGGLLLRLTTLRVGIFPPVHIPSSRQ